VRCLYLVGGKEGARFSGCGLPTYSCEVIVRRGNGAVACVETRGCGYSDEIAASMGLGAFGLIAVIGYVGSLYKDEGGVPVPSVLTNVTSSRIQLYEYLVYDKPSPWRAVVKENYLLWFTLYSVAHLLMYVEPQRNLFRPWKLSRTVQLYLGKVLDVRGSEYLNICTVRTYLNGPKSPSYIL